MNKSFVYKLIIGIVGVCSAVMWLIGAITGGVLGFFTLGWAIAVFSGITGLVFVIRAFLDKTNVQLKRFYVYFGCALIGVCVFAVIGELFVVQDKLIMPIIAVVITVALLLGFLAIGGKKWDEGDNQKPGYKTYRERKAEEEQAKSQDENK
ncbi:MAG: hypothetical protein J6B79_07185 [Clostridia bacterium]|nr:hypothetical protein [Clostridia bacterium]